MELGFYLRKEFKPEYKIIYASSLEKDKWLAVTRNSSEIILFSKTTGLTHSVIATPCYRCYAALKEVSSIGQKTLIVIGSVIDGEFPHNEELMKICVYDLDRMILIKEFDLESSVGYDVVLRSRKNYLYICYGNHEILKLNLKRMIVEQIDIDLVNRGKYLEILEYRNELCAVYDMYDRIVIKSLKEAVINEVIYLKEEVESKYLIRGLLLSDNENIIHTVIVLDSLLHLITIDLGVMSLKSKHELLAEDTSHLKLVRPTSKNELLFSSYSTSLYLIEYESGSQRKIINGTDFSERFNDYFIDDEDEFVCLILSEWDGENETATLELYKDYSCNTAAIPLS